MEYLTATCNNDMSTIRFNLRERLMVMSARNNDLPPPDVIMTGDARDHDRHHRPRRDNEIVYVLL